MTSELEQTLHNSRSASQKSTLELNLEKTNQEISEFEQKQDTESLEYQALLIQRDELQEQIEDPSLEPILQKESKHPKWKKFGKVAGNSLLSTVIAAGILTVGTFLIGYNLPPVADERAERRIDKYQEARGTDYISMYDGDIAEVNIEYLTTFFDVINSGLRNNFQLNGSEFGLEYIVPYLDDLVYREKPRVRTVETEGKQTFDSLGTIDEYLHPVEEAQYEGIDLRKGSFILYVNKTTNVQTFYKLSITPQESSTQMTKVDQEPHYSSYSMNVRNMVELYDAITAQEESGLYLLNTMQINDAEAPVAQIGFELEKIAMQDEVAEGTVQENHLDADYLGVVLYHLDQFNPQVYSGSKETFIGSVQTHINENNLPINFTESLQEKAMEYYNYVKERNLGA